jgi:hypothetical protein
MLSAKEFLKKELGSDLPDSLGNQTAHWMEKYSNYKITCMGYPKTMDDAFKKEENESKNNERSEEPLVRESNWIRFHSIRDMPRYRKLFGRNSRKRN